MSNKGSPGLCVVGTDLLIAFRDGADHGATTGANRGQIKTIVSSDGGRPSTWGSLTTIVNDTTNQYDAREPFLLTHSGGNIIMTYFLHNGTTSTGALVARSTDSGSSWTTGIALTNGFTGVAVPSGNMVELSNGNVIAPMYGTDSGDTDTSVKVSQSTDSGATWSALGEVVDGQAAGRSYQEPSLVALTNGSIGCMMRTDDNQFYWSTSSDSGATWAAPTSVGWGDQPSGKPALQVAPDGTLICTYRALGSEWMSRYRFSTDNGATWSSYVVLIQFVPGVGDADYYWYSQMVTFGGAVYCAHAFQTTDSSATVYFSALYQDGSSRLN